MNNLLDQIQKKIDDRLLKLVVAGKEPPEQDDELRFLELEKVRLLLECGTKEVEH